MNRTFKHGLKNRNTTFDQQDRLYFWKQAVLKRGNFLCFITKKPSSKKDPLVCHHLEAWSLNVLFSFDVTNGVCLLRSLHRDFHSTRGWNKSTTVDFENYCKEEHKVVHFPWAYGNHEPSVTLNEMKENQKNLRNIYREKLEKLILKRKHLVLYCIYENVRSPNVLFTFCTKN